MVIGNVGEPAALAQQVERLAADGR